MAPLTCEPPEAISEEADHSQPNAAADQPDWSSVPDAHLYDSPAEPTVFSMADVYGKGIAHVLEQGDDDQFVCTD